MVGVVVAVESSVGALVGVGFKPEQAAISSPQAARCRSKNRFAMMVSFIVPKIGRIVAQGDVQSSQSVSSTAIFLILLRDA